jgi:hypothetical protein
MQKRRISISMKHMVASLHTCSLGISLETSPGNSWRNNEYSAVAKGKESMVFPKDLADAVTRISTYSLMVARSTSKKDHNKNVTESETEDEVPKAGFVQPGKRRAFRKKFNVLSLMDQIGMLTERFSARSYFGTHGIPCLFFNFMSTIHTF